MLLLGSKAVRCRAAPLKQALADSLEEGGRMDGWGSLPSVGSQTPLPGQEARAAAELNEEFPFTQPVRLHHLAECLISVAARVVGDAGGSQLCEARLTPATVPAGACTAQAVLITPSTHFVGQARHLLWVEPLTTGWHTLPVLEVEVFCTVNALFSAWPHAGSAGVMAFPTSDQL